MYVILHIIYEIIVHYACSNNLCKFEFTCSFKSNENSNICPSPN